MPLSKKRMRERKRHDRLLYDYQLTRFDNDSTIEPVKPKTPELDIDGNIIPDYE